MIKVEDMKVAKLATAPDDKVVSVTHLQIDKENITGCATSHPPRQRPANGRTLEISGIF